MKKNKNIAINTLKYTGVVTLSQYIGTKKIKIAQVENAGANPLFNFFSDCLLGDFSTAKINRPTKIMLLLDKQPPDSDTQLEIGEPRYESKSGFIYLLSKPEKVYVNNQCVVRYSFIVARDILEGATFNSIGLYTNATDDQEYLNFAAIANINVSKNKMAAASALVVEWELHISNSN